MFYNRTYFDKCATIVRGSKLNTGFNPVSDLVYGRNVSRTLIHFNHDRIKKMVDDKVFPDMSKMRHHLKITNAGSLDMSELHKVYGSQIDGAEKKRATSFDLIFFLIPKPWDNGKGFDYTRDYFNIEFYDDKAYQIGNYISEDGANWFKPTNGKTWKDKIEYQITNDEQMSFYIKADRKIVGMEGGRVTFMYMCCCNDGWGNTNLNFRVVNNSVDSPVVIGSPIYYSASGQICHNDAEIMKYGKYVKVTVDFPKNESGRIRKYTFVVESDKRIQVDDLPFYIGASTSETITPEIFEKMTKFTAQDGRMIGDVNTNFGDYIWFAVPSDVEIDSVTSSNMIVTLSPDKQTIQINGVKYNCYKTLKDLDIAYWKLNINPKEFIDATGGGTIFTGKKYSSNPYRVTQEFEAMREELICEDGIYSTKTLDEQLNLYECGSESIIIGKQHFDIGCENIDVDITDVFNKFITGELENNGIGIAFAPEFEYSDSQEENYVGLLTNRTNSFFEPYVETIYESSIADDRQNFVLGRLNRLYLYTNIGGELVNLDTIPTCTIGEYEYEVKQASKGVYYIEVTLPYDAFSAPTMLYDKWDNIIYHGEHLEPVEMEFTTQPAKSYFQLGNQLPENGAFTPTCYGINDSEHIKRGDVRKVCFLFKKDYTKNTGVMVDDVEVRLYVMDGTAQVTVIPYIKAERAFNDIYIMLDTSILIPNTYYMDVRVKYGMEMIEHHDIIHFTIVNEENNRYA